jgi:hypothetical protein
MRRPHIIIISFSFVIAAYASKRGSCYIPLRLIRATPWLLLRFIRLPSLAGRSGCDSKACSDQINSASSLSALVAGSSDKGMDGQDKPDHDFLLNMTGMHFQTYLRRLRRGQNKTPVERPGFAAGCRDLRREVAYFDFYQPNFQLAPAFTRLSRSRMSTS